MAKVSKEFPKHITLRMESELLELLQVDATAHGRTVGQTIRFHLWRALRPAD